MRNIANGRDPNPPGTIEDLNVLEEITTALLHKGYPNSSN